MISSELSRFVESGVSVLVGTRDASLFPESVRALGALAPAGGEEVTVFVPRATAAATVANLGDNGRVSVCFTRIQDHRSLQPKGGLVELRDARADERPAVERYRLQLAENLGWIGLPRRLSLRIASWPCHAVRFRVESVFDQTPGPGAGEALRPPEQETLG